MAQPVGIVLVSHSAALADGLRQLVGQVAGDDVPVSVAAGTVDGRLGTSDELIRAAIGDADRGGGVVLLADLGSAVLTARTVLDDLERADVVLVDAPFVEGAVAATVLAGTGASLAEVVAAAREARDAHKL
jgi:phosphoenolpyruvate---glycerone phosphotransferase subunit DhaM